MELHARERTRAQHGRELSDHEIVEDDPAGAPASRRIEIPDLGRHGIVPDLIEAAMHHGIEPDRAEHVQGREDDERLPGSSSRAGSRSRAARSPAARSATGPRCRRTADPGVRARVAAAAAGRASPRRTPLGCRRDCKRSAPAPGEPSSATTSAMSATPKPITVRCSGAFDSSENRATTSGNPTRFQPRRRAM